MADVTIASNASGAVGVWNKYYYKPFDLGNFDNTGSGEDGGTYITQTSGTSANNITARCFSAYNCGYYYKLHFSGTDRNFYVKKYDSADNYIDRIYASVTTGLADGNWWKAAEAVPYTIDVGVSIVIPNDSFDSDDEYKITLPSIETMERRRIYHGGFSSFVRMPSTEGKSHHSDIIPVNLKDRNITLSFNQYMGDLTSGSSTPEGLNPCPSLEDAIGNLAISVFLEWSVDKDAANSNAASDVATYGWGAGEKWQLGTMFAGDVNPTGDTPIVSQSPQSDTAPVSANTGTNQLINITCAGRAGYAKIRTEYQEGSGTPRITAHNQFWPVTIMID